MSLIRLKNYIQTHRNVVDGIVLNALYKVLQLVLSVATTYFIVRSLSQEDYGNYNYIFTIVGIVSLFSLPGMHFSITQSMARGFDGTYRKALSLSIIASLLGSLVLLGFFLHFYLNESMMMAYAFLIAAIFFPLVSGLDKWRAHALGKEIFRKTARISSINAILTGIGITAACVIFPGNILYLLLMVWLIPALQNIRQTYVIWKQDQKNGAIEEGSIAYGMKTTAYSSLGLIASNIDSFLIFHMLSPASLAIFVAAQKLPEVIKAVIQDIGRTLLPKFSRHKTLKKEVIKFFRIFAITVGAAIMIFTFTLFPFVFRLIFGDTYEGALPYAQFMMVSMAIANVAPLKAWFIYSKLDARSYRDTTLLTSVLRIALSIVLIPLYGIWGAVASVFLHRLITSVLIDILIKKRYAQVEQG